MQKLIAVFAVVCISLGFSSGAQASEIAVSYLTDLRALRAQIHLPGTLTFELFQDASCRTPIDKKRVAFLHVDVARTVVRPAADNLTAAGRRVAAISTRMQLAHSVPIAYLRVTGKGIRAVGSSCQPQYFGI